MPANSQKLAPLASTGNNTHTAVSVPPLMQALGAAFTITAVGATPTIKYEVQGSDDGTNWKPLSYVLPGGGAVLSGPRTRTTVSSDLIFFSNSRDRLYKYYRFVTTANTNVTYDSDILTFYVV